MLVKPSHLQEALGGQGGQPFAEFMWSLIRAEAQMHGIPLHAIEWDHRVSRRDAGRDLVIRRTHDDAEARFVPSRASIWSFKSGRDGADPSKLRKELTAEAHEPVRQHLREGGAYVWCTLTALDMQQRDRLRGTADELAQEHGFTPLQIEFRGVEQIAELANEHINVIAAHLPSVANLLRSVFTLNRWARESDDLATPWVEFDDRVTLKKRIQMHLLDTKGPAALHITGLSGTGKTRTAIEACLDHDELRNVLYIPGLNADAGAFLRQIDAPGRSTRLLIDEVPLDRVWPLHHQFEDRAAHVRLVTIGPASQRDLRMPHSDSLCIVPQPSNSMATFVRAIDPTLPPDVQASIAHYSGHDLRLALLLLRSARQFPQFHQHPISDVRGVFERVMALFATDLKRLPSFERLYAALTSAVDIGRASEFRSELQFLAGHFGVNVVDLDEAIEIADSVGLGVRLPRFFEAGPRALAIWLFSDRLWPLIEANADEFIAGMPTDRLRKRFVERCHEVPGQMREEVLARVGQYFLTYFGAARLERLSERNASRLFQAWAELHPELGLDWLARAVEAASDEEIAKFDGAPDGSGGWRGRRQMVWLCEHLACFGEHFWVCERILFRLAQIETETAIANNSRNTWKAMFAPVLSNTEVPFPERWAHLLHRLRSARPGESMIELDAVLRVFKSGWSREAPPAIVGGRIVPQQWRPKSRVEFLEHLRSAAKDLFEILPSLDPSLRSHAISEIVEHLHEFASIDVLSELRRALADELSNKSLLRHLREKIDVLAARYAEHDPDLIPFLQEWSNSLTPSGLAERVRDLTARDAWVAYDIAQDKGKDAVERAYGALARELVAAPETAESLEPWFSSAECRSGRALGIEAGKLDCDGRLVPTILRWARSARADGFVFAYLSALAYRSSGLPADAVDALDQVASINAAYAVEATTFADRSGRGFERLIRCLPQLQRDQIGRFTQVGFGDWKTYLTDMQKELLLRALADNCAQDPGSLHVAFFLLVAWTDQAKEPISQPLVSILRRLLHLAADPNAHVDDYEWKVATELLSGVLPGEAAEVYATAMTDIKSRRYHRGKYAEEGLAKLAQQHPQLVMNAVGERIADPKRGMIFRILVFKGLFDAIGLETVMSWLTEHGPDEAVRIARHVAGPHVEDGKAVVPELADWLLTEYANVEDVFREFCMGRHSGVVRWGGGDDRRKEAEALVAPFRSDPRSWIQKWIKYEESEAEYEIKRFEERDEEYDRT
jgi:hypothetical protein